MSTVLMVDDEPDFLRIAERILGPAGLVLETAATAEAAWEKLRSRRPSVAILDWNLPGESGVELCRRIRRDPDLKDMPVMMLTVRNLPEEQVRGLEESGADLYLTKPIEPEVLLTRIQSLLRLLEK